MSMVLHAIGIGLLAGLRGAPDTAWGASSAVTIRLLPGTGDGDAASRPTSATIAAASLSDRPVPAARHVEPAAEGWGQRTVTYLKSGEVDEPATPLREWKLDLAPYGIRSSPRLRAKLWIGPDGTVDRLELGGDPLPPQLLVDLRSMLSSTRFSPARLRGQPVGNFRDLELLIDNSQFQPDR